MPGVNKSFFAKKCQDSFSFEPMQKSNNENRVRALALLECEKNENGVALRFIEVRSTPSRLKQRVEVT